MKRIPHRPIIINLWLPSPVIDIWVVFVDTKPYFLYHIGLISTYTKEAKLNLQLYRFLLNLLAVWNLVVASL